MAGELQCDVGVTGLTVYAQARNTNGDIADIVNDFQFEAYNSANWTDYTLSMSEQGSSGYYVGDLPAVSPFDGYSGQLDIVVKKRVGGTPAETDPTVGAGVLDWDLDIVRSAANSRVDEIAVGTIGVASFVAGAINSTVAPNLDAAVSSRAVAGDAMTLTSGERIAVGTAVWATVLWGTKTAAQWARWVAAALFGKVTGSGANYKDLGTPATTVLAVTDDGGGDRTVVLTDPP